MKPRNNLITSFLVLSLVLPIAPVPLVAPAQASDLGSVDFNIAMNLAGIAQSTVSVGAYNCSDGARSFATASDLMLGLAMDTRVQTQLGLTCRPSLNIDSGVRQISGTMTIPSRGMTDGVFTADCSAKSSMSVVAAVAIGAAVPGLISVNVQSASAPLAFSCSFKGSSAAKSTDVFGTIEGFADVAGMCNSACVSIAMNARATVTAATGELKGQTGTGSYSYSDAFELPDLAAAADTLARLKGTKRQRDERVSCPEGAEDCTIYDSNPCPNGEETCTFKKGGEGSFTCPAGAICTIVTTPLKNASDSIIERRVRAGRPPSMMRVNLRTGSGEVVILRPVPVTDGAPAALTPSQPLTLTGPPLAKCTFAMKGKKVATRAVVLSANGTATVAYTTAQLTALARQLGFPAKSKTKPTVTATATCTSDAGMTPTQSKKLLLG
jgi:hypothetical protein